MNNEIETLVDPNEVKDEISSASPVTVVTSQVIPTEVETITVNDNGEVEEISLDYNEYRNDLNKMYANTTEDNSLISSFIINGDKCRHTLTVKFSDGHDEVSKSREFDYNENFKEKFLVPVVEDYNKYNSVFDSSIEVIDDNNTNFIARTKENDCLNIINIDAGFANKLRDLLPKQDIVVSKPKQLMKMPNERGIGNYLVIILTVLAVGMTLVGTIFFTIMANK